MIIRRFSISRGAAMLIANSLNAHANLLEESSKRDDLQDSHKKVLMDCAQEHKDIALEIIAAFNKYATLALEPTILSKLERDLDETLRPYIR